MTNADKLFAAAINLDLVTARDLELLSRPAWQTDALVLSDIDDYAEALRHSDPEKRSKWFAAREAVAWLESGVAREKEDRFGFKADARAKARAALDAVGV